MERGSEGELEIIHQDDDLVAVNKPVGMPTHAPRPGLEGVVERLTAQLGGAALGVHQRLDAVTSGVLVFSRSPRGAKALARAFEERTARKSYLALCLGGPRKTRGVLRHWLRRRGGLREAHEEAGLGRVEAVTRYAVEARLGGWTRLSLTPKTGRTHQLRAQLSAVGSPILGDVEYGGGEGTGRVLLHAHRLSFEGPDGRPLELTAPPPPLLREGVGWRQVLAAILGRVERPTRDPEDDARRLLEGEREGVPGVVLERYGAHGALHLLEDGGDWEGALEALGEACAAWAGLEGVQLKRHVAHGAKGPEKQATALWGAPPQDRFEVREEGVRYEVSLAERYGSGLYLDQRENRRWAREEASKGVEEALNLFAYTCSFSVAAAVGGAGRVTSVDLSKRALRWGRENFERNGLDVSAHRFFSDEVFEALERAQRRGDRYDLIICDPPSFARSGKRRFVLHRDLASLVEGCARVARGGARLLFCLNHRKTSAREFEAKVREGLAAAGRGVASLSVSAPRHERVGAGGTALKSARVTLTQE